MLLAELIEGLPITASRGDPAGLRVTDLTEDSRTVMPGSVFVARVGLRSDGRAFALEAVRAGASAILTERAGEPADLPPGLVVLSCDDVRTMTALLAERINGHPSRRLLVAGITGTNGKSTVAHLVHGLLNRCGLRCGLIGTVGVDDGSEFAAASMTTPPAIEISRTLATMVESGCEAAVMEVSSHALDQRRADGVSFDAAAFTNISGDHADYHGAFANYLRAKRRLLEMLTDGAPGILNADDGRVAACARDVGSGNAVTCSMESSADWTVVRTNASIDGESLIVSHEGSSIGATLPLIGGFNAMNTCQAVATAWELLGRAGIDETERALRLSDALSLATAPCGRLEPVHGPGDDIRVFVDFAHTDDALDRTLETVRTAIDSDSQLTVVFGCGGDRDRGKRPRMGAVATARADRVVLTSDNPRSEPPLEIIDAIMGGMPPEVRSSLIVHADRERAINEAIAGASAGGAIVIAGKGHEVDQVSSDGEGRVVSRRFVDQDVARAALASRRTKASSTGTSNPVTA